MCNSYEMCAMLNWRTTVIIISNENVLFDKMFQNNNEMKQEHFEKEYSSRLGTGQWARKQDSRQVYTSLFHPCTLSLLLVCSKKLGASARFFYQYHLTFTNDWQRTFLIRQLWKEVYRVHITLKKENVNVCGVTRFSTQIFPFNNSQLIT